jgi:hypothetical protein
VGRPEFVVQRLRIHSRKIIAYARVRE